MLRNALIVFPIFLVIGCNSNVPGAAKPLASGRIVHVTCWEKPVAHEGSNSGSSPPEGSMVDIYDSFIIIRQPNGYRSVSPHGWYTNLIYEEVKQAPPRAQ